MIYDDQNAIVREVSFIVVTNDGSLKGGGGDSM